MVRGGLADASQSTPVQKTAQYSGCELRSVPSELPEETEELFLNNNRIEFLINSSFAPYSYLKKLSCSGNRMTSLHSNVFSKNSQLHTLNLGNNLLYTHYKQTAQALSALTSLRNLDVSGNVLTEDMAALFVQNLTNLEILSLSHNILMRLDESVFSRLHSLRELNLERNLLYEIEEDAFHGLANLQVLNIAFNQLPCIVDFHLTSVVHLNLSHNAIEWFLSSQNQEEAFQLETLDLSVNRLLFFPLLPHHSHIKNLLLSGNQLAFRETTENGSSSKSSSMLQFVFLNGTVINISSTYLWEETLQRDISSLNVLDMTYNCLTHLPKGFIKKMTALTGLLLGHNTLESLDFIPSEIPVSLQDLDLSDNDLSNLKQSFPDLPPHLQVFNLSLNGLQHFPRQIFSGLSKIKLVDLSFNHLGICSFNDKNSTNCVAWNDINSLQFLYLRGCDLKEIPTNAFSGSPIAHLELSDNQGILLPKSSLQGLSQTLVYLGLRNTSFTDVDFSVFQKLKFLDISVNCLTQIPNSVLRIHLSQLNLRDNKLTAIDLTQTKVLSRKVNAVLLGGNPFNCCSLDWWHFLQRQNSTCILDRTDVKCIHSTLNQGDIHVDLFLSSHCNKRDGESIWLYVLLFLPICLTFVCAGVVFILSFNPRLLPRFIKRRCRSSVPY
uniref:Negative regulator of reactive oxygen species n=1 Tax=Erpetoichthys calabaricus TaxID=27687 RepID=A0A8C4S1W8_ERPCA